jgi:thiol-disulfide isomerase/thioredoxin
MLSKGYGGPLVLFVACAVVGALAAVGKFNSIMNFPVIFALICLGFGLASLWRDRARVAVAPVAFLLLLGVALAVGGWVYQKQVIRASLQTFQEEVFASLGGKPAPRLAGLDALNTDLRALEEAASLTSRATIIAFWATWCSPCWKEMAELEELYQEHRGQGLTVLAIADYDHPEDEEGRQKDRAAAEEFLDRRGFHYPAALTANDEIFRAYKVRSIPSTALVDAEGNLVAYGVGLDGARSLMSKAAALVTGVKAAAEPSRD